jgi:hypothetical protein
MAVHPWNAAVCRHTCGHAMKIYPRRWKYWRVLPNDDTLSWKGNLWIILMASYRVWIIVQVNHPLNTSRFGLVSLRLVKIASIATGKQVVMRWMRLALCFWGPQDAHGVLHMGPRQPSCACVTTGRLRTRPLWSNCTNLFRRKVSQGKRRRATKRVYPYAQNRSDNQSTRSRSHVAPPLIHSAPRQRCCPILGFWYFRCVKQLNRQKKKIDLPAEPFCKERTQEQLIWLTMSLCFALML